MTRCHFDVNISHWFNCLVLPRLLYRAIKTRMSLISTKCSQKILHIPHILIILTVINQSTPVYLVPCVRPSLPRLPPCTSSIVLQLWTLGWHANLQPTYFLNNYHLFCAKCLPPVRSVTHQRYGDACNKTNSWYNCVKTTSCYLYLVVLGGSYIYMTYLKNVCMHDSKDISYVDMGVQPNFQPQFCSDGPGGPQFSFTIVIK